VYLIISNATGRQLQANEAAVLTFQLDSENRVITSEKTERATGGYRSYDGYNVANRSSDSHRMKQIRLRPDLAGDHVMWWMGYRVLILHPSTLSACLSRRLRGFNDVPTLQPMSML